MRPQHMQRATCRRRLDLDSSLAGCVALQGVPLPDLPCTGLPRSSCFGALLLCRLFPLGSRLAVKEPYFKQYLDGTCGLRVDNPQDIVFLPPASEDDAGAGGGGSSDAGAWDPSQGGGADRQELCRRGNEMFG